MRYDVWLLAASAILAAPANAGFMEDARTCYQGTLAPSQNHLPYCTRAIGSGRLSARDLAMTYNNRGFILRGLGRLDEALADFGRALRLDPVHRRALMNRGMILYERGKLDGALADFERGIEAYPSDSRMFVNRSLVYMARKRFDAALRDLNTALALNPEDPLALHNRAKIHHRNGDSARAMADIDNAIAAGIDDFVRSGGVSGDIYLVRAAINLHKADYRAALRDVDKAIQLNRNLAKAHNAKAWLLATCPDASLRDGEAAVRAAEAAVHLADVAETRDTLAAAYAEAGRFDEAIAQQGQAIAMLKTQGRTDKVGSYEKALESFRQGRPRRMETATQ